MLASTKSQVAELLECWQQIITTQLSHYYSLTDRNRLNQQLSTRILSLQHNKSAHDFNYSDLDKLPHLIIRLFCFGALRMSLLIENLKDKAVYPQLVNVISWLPFSAISTLLEVLINDQINPTHRKFAIEVYLYHRKPILGALQKFEKESDISVLTHWITYFAEMGACDWLVITKKVSEIRSPELLDTIGYAQQLDGVDQRPLTYLQQLIDRRSLHDPQTILIFSQLTKQQVTVALNMMVAHGEKYSRLMIVGIGAAGYVRYVDWLLDMLDDPELAINAVNALQEILGNDFYLSVNRDHQKMLVDEKKEIKDYQLNFRKWWLDNRENYDASKRYMHGVPVDSDQLREHYAISSLWIRRRIALELKVNGDSQQLLNYQKASLVPTKQLSNE